MRNNKKVTIAVASILIAVTSCISFAACGKKGDAAEGDAAKGDAKHSGDTSLAYIVNRDDLEGLESEPVSTTKIDPIEKDYEDYSSDPSDDSTVADETEVKDDSEASDDGKEENNANNGGGNANVTNDAPTEIPYPDIEVFGEKNEGDDVPLQNVTINGTTINIREDTVAGIMSKIGVKQNKSRSHTNTAFDNGSYDGIFFYGKGYGVDAGTQDPEYRFTGTHFYLEGMLNGDQLAMNVDTTSLSDYGIRCLYSSLANTKDFELVFINGVKCGMDRSTVEGLIGMGNTSKCYTYYANNNNVLFLMYTGDIVTDIYLVNDYERVPVRYSPSEEKSSIDGSSIKDVEFAPPPEDGEKGHVETAGEKVTTP